jgi:hypothetical protein
LYIRDDIVESREGYMDVGVFEEKTSDEEKYKKITNICLSPYCKQ